MLWNGTMKEERESKERERNVERKEIEIVLFCFVHPGNPGRKTFQNPWIFMQ